MTNSNLTPLHRTVDSEGYIQMSKPFADPTSTVELIGEHGVWTTTAAVLNDLYADQLKRYQAEASVDARGVLVGPTGDERPENTIRKVGVSHLVAGSPDRQR